jgi:NAD(P)-dependent dehydrogenase (short-subunit alcohol dehydrogenase family)
MPVTDLFGLEGTIALVSGGSRGLGLEIALGLGQAGAQVAITARREPWLTRAQEELTRNGITSLPIACDVANPDQVAEAVAATLRTYGRIDVLVNSAGMAWAAPAEAMTLEKWRQVMDTNATGCFLMCQAVGREMIRQGQGGTIINLASFLASHGSDPETIDAVGYSASKGAVVSLTLDLAVKWARYGIRVNAIAPGYFDTRLSAGVLERARDRIEALTPMGRIGRPGEIKGVAIFLASRAASYVTGHVLAVDGGMTVL